MFRPNPFQQTTQLLKSQRAPNLKQKLGLYQVFQRLYDNNPALLDELISLENLPTGQGRKATTPFYIIGNCIDTKTASLTTNLLDDRSQTLHQPEQVWLLGRAPDSGICLDDSRLSRYHAAIQFSAEQGFELLDLGSTNGSFVNGEAVRHRQQLKEGDRLRLGSLTIYFFEQPEARRLPQLTDAIMKQFGSEFEEGQTALEYSTEKLQAAKSSNDETLVFLRGEMSEDNAKSSNHSQQEQSDRQGQLLERLKKHL